MQLILGLLPAEEGSAATVTVRYIVDDVDASIDFRREHLGFREVMHPARAFAMPIRGDLRLALSAPGGPGGGGKSMPDGTPPTPGGWNRFSLEVPDLEKAVEPLRRAGVHFRNDMVTGVAGRQVLLEDPSGNPVELFEPTRADRIDLGTNDGRSGSASRRRPVHRPGQR